MWPVTNCSCALCKLGKSFLECGILVFDWVAGTITVRTYVFEYIFNFNWSSVTSNGHILKFQNPENAEGVYNHEPINSHLFCNFIPPKGVTNLHNHQFYSAEGCDQPSHSASNRRRLWQRHGDVDCSAGWFLKLKIIDGAGWGWALESLQKPKNNV